MPPAAPSTAIRLTCPKPNPTSAGPFHPTRQPKSSTRPTPLLLRVRTGLASIGLRYFNVFGPRQDPMGAYAAVIPAWISALLKHEPVYINGDGETSRDFCFIDNVVQANLLAATTTNPEALDRAYNIALGERTTLNELFRMIQDVLRRADPSLPEQQPVYRDFRPGDVRHSLADITRAQQLLGYAPTHRLAQGLDLAMDWYKKSAGIQKR